MSKTKILLIQIAGCLALGTVLGMAFWLFDGGKTREKASECVGGVSGVQELASGYGISKNDFGSYDVLLPSGLICGGHYPSVEAAKKQIAFLVEKKRRVGKLIKIYKGRWHKEGYLEVVGK